MSVTKQRFTPVEIKINSEPVKARKAVKDYNMGVLIGRVVDLTEYQKLESEIMSLHSKIAQLEGMLNGKN